MWLGKNIATRILATNLPGQILHVNASECTIVHSIHVHIYVHVHVYICIYLHNSLRLDVE